MLTDSQTVTVSSQERTYVQAFDAEFAKDIANGAGSVRKTAITDGNSILKIANAANKGVERHQIMLRDKVAREDGTERIRQAYLVLSFSEDDPTELTATVELGKGLLAKAAETGLLARVCAGES